MLSSDRNNTILAVTATLGASAMVYSAIFKLRVRKNNEMLLPVVEGKVLDVGCWDGDNASKLMKASKGKITSMFGIDPFLPEKTAIPAKSFDGVNIPLEDKSFDVALSSYILHHAGEQADPLLGEMKRVAKRIVIAEDYVDTKLARWTTIFLHELMVPLLGMDYDRDYFHTKKEWKALFDKHGLRILAQKEYSSIVLLFPTLRHTVYVLVDKEDKTAVAPKMFDPTITLIDALNYGFYFGLVPGLLWMAGSKWGKQA